MEETTKTRSRYFQTIALEFFKRRGAPFFLSSKDIALIAKWESLGIPLQIVLEGMEKSFEAHPGKIRARSRVLTLGYCEYQVMKAFSQHRERGVGRAKKIELRGEKKEKVAAELRKFLVRVPREVGYLNEVFERALGLLSRGEVDEEGLEKLEDEVEEKLIRFAPEALKDELRKAVHSELPAQKKGDAEGILNVSLVKQLRDAYKIPYISLFYY